MRRRPEGSLAGREYWVTPEDAVEEGETFEAAAVRELAEETGLHDGVVGDQVGRRQFVLELPSGERVMADERFFVVRTASSVIFKELWTDLEGESIAGHRWWSPAELAQTTETVFPEDLLELARVVKPGQAVDEK